MKIEKNSNYILLADEKDNIADFARYLESQVPKNYKDANLVVDLLKYESFDLEQLLLFVKISTEQRAKKLSFVLVNDAINPDEIPNEMMVVPSLQEAEDIVEMEEIERDLGF